MAHFHAPKHLVKRGEIYYFRLAIPARLHHRFNAKELKFSLQTEDRQLARIRCRNLTNKFEKLFKAIATMPELTQEKLQEIARGYFRDLLIDDNDEIFWLEEMHGNTPDQRASLIASTEAYHKALKDQHQQGIVIPGVPDDIAKKLSEGGIEGISQSSDSYNILCNYFIRAKIESARILYAKLKKDYSSTMPLDPLYAGIMDDTLPPMPEFGLTTATQDMPLGELVEKFMSSKAALEYKSRLDFERVLKWFTECMGEKRSVRTITTQDIGAFRDTMLKVPKNYSKMSSMAGLTLKQAIEASADIAKISPKTAEKYLHMARGFLIWCEAEGYILGKVPGSKITIEYKATEKPRLPFSNEQMAALFASPIWTGCQGPSRRSRSGNLILVNAYYWIPLIAAYTGMRCGEIVQLRHTDILNADGIPYFSVNDDADKKIKTKFSERRIPIHPRLKDWGFLDFLAERRSDKPNDRVFHEIKITSNNDPSNAFSKAFARYLKDIELKNKTLTFHSFRHTFSDALDNASVIDTHKKMMMGHSDGSSSAQYGSGAAVSTLLEQISKISYDFEKSFDPLPASRKIIKGAAAWA